MRSLPESKELGKVSMNADQCKADSERQEYGSMNGTVFDLSVSGPMKNGSDCVRTISD